MEQEFHYSSSRQVITQVTGGSFAAALQVERLPDVCQSIGRWFDKPRGGSSVRNNILQVDDVYIVGHFAIQLAALNGGRDWIDCRHITERNVRNVSLAESTGSPAALHYSTQRPWPAALKTLFSLAARSQVSRERLQQQFRSRLIIQMRLARPCLFPYFSPYLEFRDSSPTSLVYLYKTGTNLHPCFKGARLENPPPSSNQSRNTCRFQQKRKAPTILQMNLSCYLLWAAITNSWRSKSMK